MTASIRTIDTPLGVVEADVRGVGIPVLVLHGSPGGVDAALMMSRFLPPDRFRTIAVSRPGYLGTPLDPSDSSIDREADLLDALLETVGIARAGVLAWSGGGPSAYRLATRHPERVSSLVQVAALSGRWTAPDYPASDRFLFGTVPGGWAVRLLARFAPEQLVSGALASEGSVRGEELAAMTSGVMADAAQREAVLAAAATMSWAGPRRPGWDNDVRNYAAIDSLQLDRVRCPVLLVHGDADTDASPDYSRAAHERLPQSELVVVERGTHLCFYAHPEAPALQERAREWFAANH